MANDSLMACMAAAARISDMPLSNTVTSVSSALMHVVIRAITVPVVIPAKAGIQPHHKSRCVTTTALDTRLRGYDGVKDADGLSDAVEIFGAGV